MNDALPTLTTQAVHLKTNLHQSQGKTERFSIELTDRDLERIEELRGGDDLNLTLEGSFHVYNSRNDEFDTATTSVEDRIPRSDWADVLTEFEYGDIKVLELYFPDSPAREHFEKAWEHAEDADEQFARGDWGETLTHCRKAIEVIDNLERAEDVDRMIGEEKWERMGRLKGDLSSYLSLGPHSEEGIGHEAIKRRDA